MATEAQDAVLTQVIVERAQQDAKWGEQNHNDFVWAAGLGEEFGEACQAALKASGDEDGTPRPEMWSPQLRMELIQVAAVAVAWVECIDRRRSHA